MRPAALLPPPVRQDRRPHLREVPAPEPRMERTYRHRRFVAALIAFVVLAGAFAGVTTWEQHRLGLQNDKVASLTTNLQASTAKQTALFQRTQTLVAKIAAIQARLATVKTDVPALRAELRNANAALGKTEQALVRATGLTGRPIADGTYAARIMAVSGGADPARIVFDQIGWPAEPTARPAGVPATDDNAGWRVMPVAATAPVVLVTWHGWMMPETIAFQKFVHIANGTAWWNARMLDQRYLVTATNGTITAIKEIYIP
jgi:hypothetical protein